MSNHRVMGPKLKMPHDESLADCEEEIARLDRMIRRLDANKIPVAWAVINYLECVFRNHPDVLKLVLNHYFWNFRRAQLMDDAEGITE